MEDRLAVKAALLRRTLLVTEESDVPGVIIRGMIRASGTCTISQFHRIVGFRAVEEDDGVLFDSESFGFINSIHPSLIDKVS